MSKEERVTRRSQKKNKQKGKKKFLIPAFILLLLLGGGAALGAYLHSQAPVEEPIEETEVAKEPEKEEPEEVKPVNFLTGLPVDSEKIADMRPVAVMVSNIGASMPQNGIGSADVIFEIPVEGGATRLMVVFGNQETIPALTPVRSARMYFPILAQSLDSIYVYWGSHPAIFDPLHSMLGEERFDGALNTGGLYGRDQGRLAAGVPLEHTGIFDGTRFREVALDMEIRLDRPEDSPKTAFVFHEGDELKQPSANKATIININFSGTTADFTFDEEHRVYRKDFNGTPHIDGATGKQLEFTNVFVLETDILVNAVGHNEFAFSGSGFYFSDGAFERIRWEKNDRLQFFTEDGKEIEINRGKSYIGITRVGGTGIQPAPQEEYQEDAAE